MIAQHNCHHIIFAHLFLRCQRPDRTADSGSLKNFAVLLRIRRRLCVLLLLRTSTAYVSHCYVVSLFMHGHCMCVRAPRTSNGLVDLVCERLLALSIYHLLLTLDVLCAHTVQSVCFAFPHVCSHLSHVLFFFPSDRSLFSRSLSFSFLVRSA